MKIEKVVEEIRKETEEEIKKILLSGEEEIKKIEKETENRLKEIEERWEKIREKEILSLKEKLQGEIEKEAESLILEKKNEILNMFKEYVKKELLKEKRENLKSFFLKEIEKSCETGKEKIVIGKDFKDLFNDSFKKKVRETVKKRLGHESIEFKTGETTEVIGEGFIVNISPIRKIKESWKSLLLEIPKILFSEEEK